MKAPGSKRLKMPFLSSIITIGSRSLRLEIFQMTREGREVLEYLEQNINLNADISKRGTISLRKVSQLCDIMQEFAQRQREYEAKYYRVIIDCAVREATNCDILINRIKTIAGIDIELLSPAEEIRLLFLLIREQLDEKYDFKKVNALSFAIGSSALLLMGSEQGKLKFCESIPLRLIRSFDRHGDCKIKPHKILNLLESLNIGNYFQSKSSPYLLIGVGENLRALVNINKKYKDFDHIELTGSKLSSILKRFSKFSIWQLVDKYHINDVSASGIVFSRHIVKAFMDVYKCKKILFPPFSIYDALAADMIRNKSKLFEDDIIHVTEGIGIKYNYDAKHIENVTVNCLKIFDKLQKKYDLNKRSRLLLHLAARLHDLGRFVDLHQYNKHSYYLIRNTQLPGISEKEQLIVATVACCYRKRVPRKHPKYAILSKAEKVSIDKLTSILLLGDDLDNFSHCGLDELSIRLSKTNLTIKIPNCSEDLLEQMDTNNAGNLFRETFGLEIKLCEVPGNYEI
jgi:exopolyphosphatase / guanosine-5'-triphosphate,3'-diphosphate pyrophosphatase